MRRGQPAGRHVLSAMSSGATCVAWQLADAGAARIRAELRGDVEMTKDTDYVISDVTASPAAGECQRA